MPLKVFYLDDEPDLCEIFSEEFSSHDIHMSTFTDWELAVEKAKSNPPDLIFIDYRLPGTNGDQVAQKMAKHIPKFLITGESSVSTVYKFESVLTKPYDRESIRNVLKNMIVSKTAN